jgi:glycosidase
VRAFRKKQWKDLLHGLYAGPQTDFLLERIPDLLEKHRSSIASSGIPRRDLSERDVILITYPDQIRRPGADPLGVLSDFCRERLGGIISTLHVLPFYPSSSDDGFAVTDYRRVDPALGGWDDIARLGKDFRLMTDAVFNHISSQSGWFQGFLRGEEKYRGFFIEQADRPELARVVRPRTTPLLHVYEGSPAAKTVWTTFSRDQVDLNYKNPELLLEMLDLLLFYAARGASILRLDAVAYLWKEVGTPCISLPQAHRLVRLFRAALDACAPHAMLVTETNVPQDENFSYFGTGGDEANLVYNFSLPPLVWHTFRTGDSRQLSRWVESLPAPGRHAALLNFLASHDGIGLNAAREILAEEDVRGLIRATLDHGGRISGKRNPDGSVQPYELNINYFDALSAPPDGEPVEVSIRRFLAAHAVLLSLAGIPAIYFHSLFGSRGWMEGVERTGRNRSINRQKFQHDEFEAELADRRGLRGRVFAGLSDLIRARAQSPAFDPYGIQKTVDCGNAVFALKRIDPESGRAVLYLQEVSGRSGNAEVDLAKILGTPAPNQTIVDLLNGERFDPLQASPLPLDAYQSRWLALRGGSASPGMERIGPA